MVEIAFIAPLLTGIIAFFLGGRSSRPLLTVTGALHLLISVLIWTFRPGAAFPDYFGITPEGLLSLLVISLLFFMISIYTTAYLSKTEIHSERIFTGCMLLFLATMTMVTLSDHIMVMWIAIEATTLASAPLIYTHRSAASMEATWKYVLICSVGIALALLGSVLITLSMDVGGVYAPVSFSSLTDVAGQLDPFWLKTGFRVYPGGLRHQNGFGPHAHLAARRPQRSAQPGFGAAFRRLAQLCLPGHFQNQQDHAGRRAGGFFRHGADFLRPGLDLAAATFILKQTEYKRLLAYSSIENMGIIAFGTGVGGIGAYGAMLCLIHHSLIKSSLFLSSGNILLGYGSRLIDGTGKLARLMPKTFVAFFGGFAGISGFPPFGIFMGELFIVIGAFRRTSLYWRRAFYPQHLRDLRRVCQPYHENLFRRFGAAVKFEENATMVWPQYALLLTSVVLCFWMPETLYQAIMNAVNSHRRRVLMKREFLQIDNGEAVPRDRAFRILF
jgi:hydrogenase-4 component F